MKKLFVNKIKFKVIDEDNNTYGVKNPLNPQLDYLFFNKGVNVIYGENSIGKSSILTGIVYCLGGEKIFGVTALQSPFKPEFNSLINNKKVVNSSCLLEINNGEETISISRDIMGENKNICVVKFCKLEDFEKEESLKKYIINSKGVFTEDGFGKFLFDFLGWEIVQVPQFDEGEKSPLYFENLLPLFFIEQKRGWSQIQSTQTTQYGIRDVKKISFEYLLNLDLFKNHMIELEQKSHQQKINRLRLELNIRQDEILSDLNAQVKDEKIKVTKEGYGVMEISSLIETLEKEYDKLKEGFVYLEKQKNTNGDSNEKSRNELLEISSLRKLQFDKVKSLKQEINIYESNLQRIIINKRKNNQLKKINEIVNFPRISFCPSCHSPLSIQGEDCCILCGTKEFKISSPEENLAFLEDEEKSFKLILQKKQDKLMLEEKSLKILKNREKSIKEELDYRLRTYMGKDMEKMRQYSFKMDDLFKDIRGYKEALNKWAGLDITREAIQEQEIIIDLFKSKIKKHVESKEDNEKFSEFITLFKKDLGSLGFLGDKQEIIKDIRLNKEYNYFPYVPTYDLYNGSSSSDNIRLMIAYHLSLMKLSLNANFKARFPSLLIFDEPQQQNLDKETVVNLLNNLSSIESDDWQIILTTYKTKEYMAGTNLLEIGDKENKLLQKLS
jgi:hypothetical protein